VTDVVLIDNDDGVHYSHHDDNKRKNDNEDFIYSHLTENSNHNYMVIKNQICTPKITVTLQLSSSKGRPVR